MTLPSREVAPGEPDYLQPQEGDRPPPWFAEAIGEELSQRPYRRERAAVLRSEERAGDCGEWFEYEGDLL